MGMLDADVIGKAGRVMRLIDACPFDVHACTVPEGNEDYTKGYLDGVGHVLEEMDAAPTVDAVPLWPICLLLHDIANAPCCWPEGEKKCLQLLGDKQKCSEWGDEECWAHFLRAWLRQEEPNATD